MLVSHSHPVIRDILPWDLEPHVGRDRPDRMEFSHQVGGLWSPQPVGHPKVCLGSALQRPPKSPHAVQSV